MEHVCSSRKDECLFFDPNTDNVHRVSNSNHEEETSFFLDFPSPFFDDISTAPILPNNPTHQNHRSSANKPLNITEPLASESKHLKKRGAGKKDRHSKIHTAQGLRDRRMRLSLQIARKFFDLQDLLGFDKASKTIEWLFCKSNKAIKEVAENFNPQHTNQSMNEENYEVGLTSEINKSDNSKEEIQNRESRKQSQNNCLVRDQTRDQARARARNRTRERVMIKELEKSKRLFGGNPKDKNSNKLGLGCLLSPSNHNVEELGFTSSSSEPIHQESSSPSYEHSSTQLLRKLHSAKINFNSFENFAGSIEGTSTYCSAMINHNPPLGCLNTSDRLLGTPRGWDTADSFITEYHNYGILQTTAPLTGDINYEQNPSSFFMTTTTDILHFQSQNQGNM